MHEIDFKDLVENSDDIIWQTDARGRITYINKAVERELGYKQEEILGALIPPYIPKREKIEFEKSYCFLTNISPNSFEGVIQPRQHKDGRILYFEIRGKPFFDEDGKLLGYRGISRRLPYGSTAKKIPNRQILAEHLILKSIINTLPVRIIWKDKYSQYLGANRLFLQDIGVSSLDEIVGKDDYTLLKPENAEVCRKGDLKTLHTGRDLYGIEEVFYTNDGDKMWISLYKTPLKDRFGNIFGILGAYIDITKLKEQEIKLKENEEKQALLMHQTRLAQMGQLLNNIAHQWKQPLAELNALILDMDTDFSQNRLTNERFNYYFEEFEKITEFMGDTIRSFQEYSTPSEELTLIKPEKILDEAVTMLHSRIKKIGAKIKITKNSNVKIVGTRQDILHLFLVFINNSLDAFYYRKTDDPKIDITFKKIETNRCEISLSDNAGGIDPNIAKQIFDPYFTTKFREKGRGMGLYIAKMIVENRMQGSLKLVDAKKSLFKINLKGVI